MQQFNAIVSILTVLTVGGCTPLGTYYKEGESVARLNHDLTNCEVVAAQKVPVNQQIRTTPVYVTPVTTSCYGYTCTSSGGYVSGGQVYSVDANAGLRTRVEAQCMSNKGYSFVEIPLCTQKQLSGKVVAPVKRLPRLNGSVCAATMSNGTKGIVDLSKI